MAWGQSNVGQQAGGCFDFDHFAARFRDQI